MDTYLRNSQQESLNKYLITPSVSDEQLGLLKESTHSGGILKYIPDHTQCLAQSGAVGARPIYIQTRMDCFRISSGAPQYFRNGTD